MYFYPILFENWSLIVPFFFFKWSLSPFFRGSLVSLAMSVTQLTITKKYISKCIDYITWPCNLACSYGPMLVYVLHIPMLVCVITASHFESPFVSCSHQLVPPSFLAIVSESKTSRAVVSDSFTGCWQQFTLVLSQWYSMKIAVKTLVY